MKYVHMFTGTDGKTHFKDVEILPPDKAEGRQESETMKATGILFRAWGKDYDLDWHPAPRRQFIITLEGSVELTASDGTVRCFGPGDILLADDLTGKGHKSIAVNHSNRKAIVVTLD